jgi:hypothetical protein
VGVLYNDTDRLSLDQSVVNTWEKANPKTVEQLLGAFEF